MPSWEVLPTAVAAAAAVSAAEATTANNNSNNRAYAMQPTWTRRPPHRNPQPTTTMIFQELQRSKRPAQALQALVAAPGRLHRPLLLDQPAAFFHHHYLSLHLVLQGSEGGRSARSLQLLLPTCSGPAMSWDGGIRGPSSEVQPFRLRTSSRAAKYFLTAGAAHTTTTSLSPNYHVYRDRTT